MYCPRLRSYQTDAGNTSKERSVSPETHGIQIFRAKAENVHENAGTAGSTPVTLKSRYRSSNPTSQNSNWRHARYQSQAIRSTLLHTHCCAFRLLFQNQVWKMCYLKRNMSNTQLWISRTKAFIRRNKDVLFLVSKIIRKDSTRSLSIQKILFCRYM